MPILIELFATFAKIGLFTFGGGYAMLSIIENICVEQKNWITHDEMMNITVIAESTPGPIAINCATYVGYKRGKLPGAILATLGVAIPSFVIIFSISMFMEGFLEIAWIAHAFQGIKMAVGILVLDASLKMIKKMKKKPLQIGILVTSFAVILLINVLNLHLSSMVVMLAAVLVSVAFFLAKKGHRKERRGVIYLDLLIGFLEVGLFSFGGAYAAIPLIRDVVLAHGWLNDEMLSYMIAVSESTPGPIMVNLATYVGSNKGGLLGAVIATTAVMLPAFITILFIMVLAKSLLKNQYVQAILGGLKPCVIGIILATGVYMILGNCYIKPERSVDIIAVLITCVLAVIYFGSRKFIPKGMSPIGLICLAALVGVAVYGI